MNDPNRSGIRILLVIMALWLLGAVGVALTLSEPLYSEVIDSGLFLVVCLGVLTVIHLFITLGTTDRPAATRAAMRLVIASIAAGPAAAIYSLHVVLALLGLGCTWWDDFACFYIPVWIPVTAGLFMVALAFGFYNSIRKSGAHT